MSRKKQTPTTKLGSFDGRDELATSIKVTNAGDGLSEALATEPQILHTGDVVYVLLKTEVGPIRHVPIKETKGYTREHTLVSGAATIVDDDYAVQAIEDQQDRIQRAKDSSVGQGRLDDPDDLEI